MSPALSTSDQPSSREEDAVQQDPAPVRHPHLFFEDGNLAFEAELTLFNVHRSRVLAHMEPMQDAMSLPKAPGQLSKGTVARPIQLSGVKKGDFEVFLRVLYDTNDIFLKSEALSTEELICLLRISDYFNFSAGFNYAVSKISYSFDVPWAEKLALGLRYDKEKWVDSAIENFYGGLRPRITPEDAATLGTASGLVFMVLHQGLDRTSKLVSDLLDTAPSVHADVTYDWRSAECKDHGYEVDHIFLAPSQKESPGQEESLGWPLFSRRFSGSRKELPIPTNERCVPRAALHRG
ncbi:hypothetical protein AAF712_016297 [Marasmius tenuissimus]|uniref:BTB domain-containing protein n=1 Tax=Marasmius tenuissimus TaxID=585030 RepID=A0ABR2Z8G8_9AGAR